MLKKTYMKKYHKPSIFNSFWQAGFEGADHVNGSGRPLAMNEATAHNKFAREDYLRLREFGIRTVRESVGWRVAERDGRFDFSAVESRARAARECGVQVIWTLCHFGVPPEIDLFSDEMTGRFARYCREAARFITAYSDEPGIYSPINEISFLSWAATETGLIHPYLGNRKERGYELKRRLVQASIAGIKAIREVDPYARIVHVDPLIHVAAPIDRPEWEDWAGENNESQFQALDMLRGDAEPALGGASGLLDVIGVNYYHSNQWECGTKHPLEWHSSDARRVPFADLLTRVWHRFRQPIWISETGHVGAGRGRWVLDVAEQIRCAQAGGVDVAGVCLYPITDRPDWERPEQWHQCGLWEIAPIAMQSGKGPVARMLDFFYARDLRRAQSLIAGSPAQSFPFLNQGKTMRPLIVFSHLRWDFVYQRPQQLLSRIALRRPVVFFEEPVPQSETDWLEEMCPAPNVRVLRPHVRCTAAGFHDDHLQVQRRMLREFLSREQLARPGTANTDSAHDYAVWFYTPMALPLLQELAPSAILYDCMDELAAFKNAPRQLLQRESLLLKLANTVLTGGPSLYRAKRSRHGNVHCLPSSVDRGHFAQALDRSTVHPAMLDIPCPRLGFFGVIDERFDAELLRQLADSRPNWHFVVIGPVVKIDPNTLPKRLNIHYLGAWGYAELPRFLAGWDVCLLPFARNESTQFISPTKTLEYMAAELPIVSTPITDVVEPYSGIVEIGSDATSFAAACERVMSESGHARHMRVQAMRNTVAATSWDDTAEHIDALVEASLAEGPNEAARRLLARDGEAVKDWRSDTAPGIEGNVQHLEPHGTSAASESARHFPSPAATYDHIVVGAGPTGLSAAYHAGANTLLLDKNAQVGGWCRSIYERGFTFDYAGHIMFSNDPYVAQLYQTLLGNNVHWQNREAWIYSKNTYTRYPFQGALYGLPPDVLKECLIGAIEARFGSLQAAPRATSVSSATAQRGGANATACKAESITDCCADGVAGSETALVVVVENERQQDDAAENFEQFIYRVWGKGVAKHFAIPYNQKLWAVPLSEMETSWLGGRVPMPDLEEMIAGALSPVAQPMGPNARFGYPLKGGFQALMNGFLPHLTGTLKLNARVASVSPLKHSITLDDGTCYGYKTLISTMPLPELVRAIGDEAPESVKDAAAQLRYVSVRCVNLGIGRPAVTEKHWIYYPEDSVFHRIFVQGNASPHCNPNGGFGLTCEITYSEHKPLPCDGHELINRCIADCVKVGLIESDDVLWTANQIDMPYAYVVYDHARAQNVRLIRDWLAQHHIILAGRYSEWEYYNSDHAFIAGKKAAEFARDTILNWADASGSLKGSAGKETTPEARGEPAAAAAFGAASATGSRTQHG